MKKAKLIIALLVGMVTGGVIGIFAGMIFGVHIRSDVDKAARQLGDEEPTIAILAQPAQKGLTVSLDMLTKTTLSDMEKGIVRWDLRNNAIGATLNSTVPQGAPLLWKHLNPKREN